MTDCPTGRTVTLPLVWRGDDYCAGPFAVGYVRPPRGQAKSWRAVVRAAVNRGYVRVLPAPIPTRSAAMRAVEDAVVKALGTEGGGDEM